MTTKQASAPSKALVTAGVALLGAVIAAAALRAAEAPGALAPVLALVVGGAALVATCPQWLLPGWAALTWAAVGEHWFGGLPSIVEVGAVGFCVLGLWWARDEPALLGRCALACVLVALPAVAAGLLSPEGSELPTRLARELPLLGVGALAIRSRGDLDRIFVALTAVGLFLGIGAAYSVLVGPSTLFPLNESSAVFDFEAPRAAGPFGEANFFALSLAVLVPFALQVANTGAVPRRALGVAALIALLAGVLATGSRGGLVACGVAVLAWACLTRSRAILAVIPVTGVLLAVFAAQIGGAQTRAVDGRTSEYAVAVAMFAERPLTGVGPGAYAVRYRDVARRVGSDPRTEREAHSLPLEVLAEQGAAGVLGWTAMLVLVLGAAWRAKLGRDPEGRILLLAIATYGAGSLFLHGGQQRLLFLLLGAVLAAVAFARRERAC